MQDLRKFLRQEKISEEEINKIFGEIKKVEQAASNNNDKQNERVLLQPSSSPFLYSAIRPSISSFQEARRD